MAALRIRPLLVVLLILAFGCQTLAAAAMHCRGEHQPMKMQVQADDHQHHDHHHEQPDSAEHTSDQAADCCSTQGQCLMACSFALASASVPPATKMSSLPLDNYRGAALPGVVASVYKPPIFA